MKKIFLMAFLAIISVTAFAQEINSEVPGRTQFFAEFGGPGVVFSANVDRRIKPNRLGLGYRVGLGFVSFNQTVSDSIWYREERKTTYTIPVQLNYIFGKPSSPHCFEVGAGITYLGLSNDIFNSNNSKKTKVLGNTSFMYRRSPIDGGFSWRIGFTPMIAAGNIYPFGAIGVGYSF